MRYSSIKKSRWRWTYDELGSASYNVLGALECVLINIRLIDSIQEWPMDEMERYSYKFSNEVNLFNQRADGFLVPSLESLDEDYMLKKK